MKLFTVAIFDWNTIHLTDADDCFTFHDLNVKTLTQFCSEIGDETIQQWRYEKCAWENDDRHWLCFGIIIAQMIVIRSIAAHLVKDEIVTKKFPFDVCLNQYSICSTSTCIMVVFKCHDALYSGIELLLVCLAISNEMYLSAFMFTFAVALHFRKCSISNGIELLLVCLASYRMKCTFQLLCSPLLWLCISENVPYLMAVEVDVEPRSAKLHLTAKAL
ncbi:hypothetical protein T11_2781 [Trichinella zimbabwensis]|uniref:Uncharacterized protein n=1 Tax=Trichinella zimbabwensis TaxID=268475 RepID=A0A0V1HJ35_9BILA|nr:hypothetical protein T11_2781 [Trichinella zimbabwensis]